VTTAEIRKNKIVARAYRGGRQRPDAGRPELTPGKDLSGAARSACRSELITQGGKPQRIVARHGGK